MQWSVLMNKFFLRRKINVELTYKCSLLCPACPRQRHWKMRNKKIEGEVLSLDNFKKIAKFFNEIDLCGQLSDPLHHPEFHKILEITNEYNTKNVKINTAISQPDKIFYQTAFKIRPNTKWVFGIDGLSNDSNRYRINQDGNKLFDIMTECAKSSTIKPTWQYIVFSYNEKDIEEAKKIANNIGVDILFLQSSRWDSWKDIDSDKFKPKTGLNTPWVNDNDKTFLNQECFDVRPFGTDIWGHLLPCCRVDDLGNYKSEMYQDLIRVSKISDYEKIEDILNTPQWKKFVENLENNKGLPHCHNMCSKGSTPNTIATDSNNKITLPP